MSSNLIGSNSKLWYSLEVGGNTSSGVLPIFGQEQPGYLACYAPGYVARVKNERKEEFVKALSSLDGDSSWDAISRLICHAVDAKDIRDKKIVQSFTPTCLTIYINNQCNLRCSYCFSRSNPHNAEEINIAAINAGANLVLKNCLRLSIPFTMVFHGGGEPMLNQRIAENILSAIENITQPYHLPIIRYVATNGVMSIRKARWMARRFQIVGISCDGPAFIQDRQRPFINGQNSSPYIEQTSRIVKDAGKRLFVRVTLTPDSFLYQNQIAEYICHRLHPDEIHVEAVYQGGRADDLNIFSENHAESYVNEFIKARQTAESYGISWSSSGNRLAEIHGPYCNIYRNVLNLIPGDVATACFKVTTSHEASKCQLLIGKLEKKRDEAQLTLDNSRIETLQAKLGIIPGKCKDCFIQYHCTYGCPDLCLLNSSAVESSSFRCETQKMLANYSIQAAIVRHARVQVSDRGVISGPVQFDT